MEAHQAQGAGLTLRIAAIHAVPLSGQTVNGTWSSDHALIAVHTDNGPMGHGSAYTDGRLVQAALKLLEPLYAGENALEPQRVSEKLHQHSFWMGRGGTLTHAISGIDMALWDIFGKVTGMPIGRLLGGSYRTRVQPYCSLSMGTPEETGELVARFREGGFRAFKIGWGPFGRRGSHALDEAIVRAARDAAGADCRLFVDAGASDGFWPNGLKWAQRTADMLAAYEIGWFEEPLRPDAIDDFRELRRSSRVPIAGGEVLTRRQTFIPWLTTGALDIVQPDATKVGGISEQRRIAWLADDFGVKLVGHGWNTALGVAADLQIAAASPSTDLVEFIGGSTYVDDITEVPFALDAEGLLPIPDGPGLGVTLDREKLARYTPDPSPLFTR